MNADNPFNFPPIDAIESLADAAETESIEFVESIESNNGKIEAERETESEIEEDFRDFLAHCQEADKDAIDATENSTRSDWYAIAEQIERALIDSEQKLELQVERSRSANRLIAQQAAELNEAQDRLSHLIVLLETAEAEKQRQQEAIDRLVDRLQQAREKTAAIERECSALQEKYQQQNDRLWQSEAQVKELNYRLDRQQRYALQFKTALNDCLEKPVTEPMRAQPIPTWSKQIYESLQAKEREKETAPRQNPSFAIVTEERENRSRSMSDVTLPSFFH